ncbi:hypothetical protein BLA29_002396 [Euroglyphus maynei]|uniref:Uncharacterized protein n=1 Tax=Euroglyphus maynei TaxID=6958 RepID=A0A1Y3APC0_EURMA|nr:hypothetical protein BLA29_002396 [Euroglyphus maynei]
MARYCGSCHLQNQFLEMQNTYVQPLKISTSNQELTIQYFSVEGILRSIINQHPSLIDEIEKEKLLKFVPEKERKNFVIRNELDTTDQSIFERLKGKLRVEISLDDFSFAGKKGRKFLAGYLSCTNLPLQERVKREQIYLFLMVKRPIDRIFDAMNKILEPFVSEMQQFEKSGIEVEKENGEMIKIQVTLSKLICDNLAQNEILGLSMAFSKSSFCRECMALRENYPSIRSHSILDSRQVNLEKSKIKNIIYKSCILTNLKGITISNIAAPDIFHDLFDSFVSLCERRKDLKFNVTFKLHKTLHYAENIRRFGPLYLSSAIRYERCHQSSKKYGRSMGCWKSPAATLSERLALRQTLSSLKRKISKENWIKQTTVSEYDAYTNFGFVDANRDQGEFLLGKNVLRRLLTPGYNPKIWLQGSNFLVNPDTRQVLVKGWIWKGIYEEDGKPKEMFNLQNIKKLDDQVIINSEHLSHINEYLFKWQTKGFFVNRFF